MAATKCESKWYNISVTREELSLADVLPTGQTFRWFKTNNEPEEWSGVIGERVFSLQQTETELKYYVHNKPVDIDKDRALIKNYFQLDTSLSKLYSDWSKVDDIICQACRSCPGVRILNQDPLETLIAFICSSNNNIRRISLMMNRLCRHFGTPLGIYESIEFYSLPTLQSLVATEQTESILRELGFGYRAKYVTGAVKYLLNQEDNWLNSLCDVSYIEAWELLQTIPGVGPKVADCICLMGLQKYQAVPIDVHIWRVSEKLYGLKVNGKNLSLAVYKQIGEMFRNKYGTHAGIAQAYTSSIDCSDLTDLLLMKRYSLADFEEEDIDNGEEEEEDDDDDDETDLAMYPSLMELSMGQSPPLNDSREDLMTSTITCNPEGQFGLVLRHFTVIANVPHSEHSCSDDNSSQSGSRSGSRCSTRSSSELYDTLHMSTLFVQSITPGGPAELSGLLQDGDIVSSINGQWISGWTTEELVSIIEESGPRLVIQTTPEHHDDLLFLYPQYIHGDPGDYTRGNSERIIVSDIIAKTSNLSPPPPPPSQEPLTRRPAYRPVSADERFLHRMTSELDTILHSPSTSLLSSTSKIPKDNSVTSLNSSELPYEPGDFDSSNDDLLISGSLADIPVKPSPLHQRKTHTRDHSSSSLTSSLYNSNNHHRREYSQDWQLSQEGEEGQPIIEWFPEADDSRGFTYSLPASVSNKSDHPFSSSMSHSGELGGSFVIQTPPTCNSPNKLARKLKATLKSLKGGVSTSSTHRKLSKTSSLGTTQTRSTSALDRLKVSNSIISQRSKSTDLGRIKLKDLSLEKLTKVNSAENVHSTSPGQHKEATPPSLSYTRPSLSQLHYTVQLPSQNDNNKNNEFPEDLTFINSMSQQLSQERNLSGESNEASRRSGGGGGRSYRSQRERLHQTRSRYSVTEESLSNNSSSLVGPTVYVPTNSASRKTSRDFGTSNFVDNPTFNNNNKVSSKYTERRHYRANRPDNSSNTYDDHRNSGFTSSQEHHMISTRNDNEHNQKGNVQQQTRPSSGGKQALNKSQSLSGGSSQEIPLPPRHGHATSVDLTSTGREDSKQEMPIGGGNNNKIPARRVLSAKPLTSTSRVVSDDSLLKSNAISNNGRKKEHKGKFNSVFHGPIQKKQERAIGGRKPSERSWKSIYAAIQGHWMVFYGTVQDALTGQVLVSEPSLDLRRCVVTVLPRKKHVFRLTFVDSSECLIQAESEEAMMRWMRIIHNLNRHIQRLGPLPPHLINRGSTQEDPPKPNKEHKLKIQRSKTPQPQKKGERADKRSREVLLDKLRKSFNPRKESIDYGGVDSNGSPCYNTFGLLLEECPASYENKSIPLVLMVCLSELEEKWLDTEGLYRVAGPMGQVRVLAEEINKGRYDLLKGHNDPHVLTGILKKFLKELPNPIIPIDQYSTFISSARESDLDLREQKLKDLVTNLPSLHYHTLGFLIRHLNKVEQHSEVNKMALRNLCIVFGPTIVRKAITEDHNSLVADMNHTYTIIELLMKKDSTLDDLSPPQQPSQTSLALKRGVSHPDTTTGTASNNKLSRFPRRSYDETNLSTFGNSMFSQERSLSTDEFFFSQSQSGRPHKKRLARSRLILTNDRDDETDELSSTGLIGPTSRSSPQLPQKKHSNSSLQRKISYSVAIEDASMLASPPIYPGGLMDRGKRHNEPFSHQGLFDSSTGQHLSPHHKSYYQTTTPTTTESSSNRESLTNSYSGSSSNSSGIKTRHSSYSSGGRQSLTNSYSGGAPPHRHRYVSTEIVGPSSYTHHDSSWINNISSSNNGIRSRTTNVPLRPHYKAPHESCL